MITVSVADHSAASLLTQIFGRAAEDAVLATVPGGERNISTVVATTLTETAESVVAIVAVVAGSREALEANITAAVCAGTITCAVRITYDSAGVGRRRLAEETLHASVNRTFTLAAIQAPATLSPPSSYAPTFSHALSNRGGRAVMS